MAMASPNCRTSSSSSRMPTTTTTNLNLPAGFRFHPTDEELIVHYLQNQAAGAPCPVPIIAEVNIYQCNPWELPAWALFGDTEWFFFSPRDRKYPNGARPNRAAASGYWKATGTDKPVLCAHTARTIGVKKALVFYAGRPPRGAKTDWIMHEYRLVSSSAAGNQTGAKRRPGSFSMRLDDWVLCRIHKKSNDFQQLSSSSDHEHDGSSTVEDDQSPKPEPFLEHDDQFQLHQTTPTAATMSKSYSLTDLLDSIDCSALSQMLDGGEAPPQPQPLQDPPLIDATSTQTHLPLNYNYNNLNNSNHLMNLPCTNAAACSADSVVVADNCNNGVKRKRMDDDAADKFFDDGSNGFSRKPKVLPDSRNISSYCNQKVVDTSGLFQSYSSLLMSYPFLEMQ